MNILSGCNQEVVGSTPTRCATLFFFLASGRERGRRRSGSGGEEEEERGERGGRRHFPIFLSFFFSLFVPSSALLSSFIELERLSLAVLLPSQSNRRSLASNGRPLLAARRQTRETTGDGDHPTVNLVAIDDGFFPGRLGRARRPGAPAHPRGPADEPAGLAGLGHEPLLVGQRRR